MMQAEVCVKQDTEATPPELSLQLRIKHEEEAVHMAEPECPAGLHTLGPECVTAHSGELQFCAAVSSRMMQAGVCVKQDTEAAPPELPLQPRIKQEEEAVHMAEPAHHTATPFIKTETDLIPTCTEDIIKKECLDSPELGYVPHLQPDQIKVETEDEDYIKQEQVSDIKDFRLVEIKCNLLNCDSNHSMVMKGAGADCKAKTEPWQYGGELSTNDAGLSDVQTQKADDTSHLREIHNGGNQSSSAEKNQCLSDTYKKSPSEKPYKCVQCGKYYNWETNLKRHQRIHSGENPWKCNQCGKYFDRESYLKRHQSIHLADQTYKCIQCGKNYKSLSHLKGHCSVHSDDNPHKCVQCGKGFNDAYSLKLHLRIHTGEKPYKCTQCEKCFSQTSHLYDHHQRIHSVVRPYDCTHCGKRFSLLSYLNRHQRIHSVEKPYDCSHCGKGFSLPSELKRHQEIHSGEKPYDCTQCGKCFRLLSHLNEHQKSHSGEKPYKCMHCEKSFKRKFNLKTHQRVHSGGET
ncbi:hypothetical protein MATL_G00039030 [Megalops atlanticus]|uniref:C2H2-type domain-containing protein n=1 Tax=Megalops atlanticus TaxID=7932 RepID=A0A9D3QFF7_MEGAT|nr:hypothetical protein MATL_G00039030 [Megalops atlanticus]